MSRRRAIAEAVIGAVIVVAVFVTVHLIWSAATWAAYFGLPTGAVYSNLIASAICAVIVFWRIRAKMATQHREQLAQNARHHREKMAQASEHHEALRKQAAEHHNRVTEQATQHHEALRLQAEQHHTALKAHVEKHAPKVRARAPREQV